MMRLAPALLCALLLAGCTGKPPRRAPPPIPRVGASLAPVAPNVHRDADGNLRSTRDGMLLLPVPGGDVLLGDEHGRYDEQPRFTARLDAFLMDATEVTNAQFERFVREATHQPEGPWRRGFGQGQGDHPVRFVTWHDAQAYAHWAGRALPTEAQWEAACGWARYPWGESWQPGLAVCDRAAAAGPLSALASEDRSPFGVLNLGGNVREWCADWYDRYACAEYAAQQPVDNPAGPADGEAPRADFVAAGAVAGNERSTRKAVRGGSWASPGSEFCRRARRGAHNPAQWFDDVGFRCVQRLGARG